MVLTTTRTTRGLFGDRRSLILRSLLILRNILARLVLRSRSSSLHNLLRDHLSRRFILFIVDRDQFPNSASRDPSWEDRYLYVVVLLLVVINDHGIPGTVLKDSLEDHQSPHLFMEISDLSFQTDDPRSETLDESIERIVCPLRRSNTFLDLCHPHVEVPYLIPDLIHLDVPYLNHTTRHVHLPQRVRLQHVVRGRQLRQTHPADCRRVLHRLVQDQVGLVPRSSPIRSTSPRNQSTRVRINVELATSQYFVITTKQQNMTYGMDLTTGNTTHRQDKVGPVQVLEPRRWISGVGPLVERLHRRIRHILQGTRLLVLCQHV